MFMIGDRVCVITTEKYDGALNGCVGTIKTICGLKNLNYGVKISGLHNPDSKQGYFYFKEYHLSAISHNAAKNSCQSICIEKVYFNNPYTIVIWNDKTKTIVKAQDDEYYDDEKGLALCIAKKALGNKGSYYDLFKKHLPEHEVEEESGEQK